MTTEKKATTGGAILIASLMGVNIINFGFNAFLGRSLSFNDYSLLTLINTLYYLLTIALTGLSGSVNHRVSFLIGKENNSEAKNFIKKTAQLSLYVAVGTSIIFLLVLPFLKFFFNESSFIPFLLFSPAILFGTIAAVNKGALNGNFSFKELGIVLLIEAVIKFLIAVLLIATGFNHLTYLSIPVSIVIAAVLSLYFIKKQTLIEKKNNVSYYAFPRKFFIAALIIGLSTNAFLSFDLLLAKHFLSPEDAGKYALLSLVGKMIFFMGSLLSSFMVTVVSRRDGQGRDPKYAFYKIFAGTAFLVINGVALLGFFGHIIVPFLFGNKALVLTPFLNRYTLAIGLFTLTNCIVLYRLARKQYIFPIFSVLSAILMGVGLTFFHQTINDFTNVVLFTAFINFLIICVLNFLVDEGKYLSRSLVDFVDLFFPLPTTEKLVKGKKKILIFNWRDTKHMQAGGAEVYVHELSKCWVNEGHKVTLFTGNDGTSGRYEIVDGVEVIRRGGFYFVYIWAFFYYMTKFRGKYDAVIDCQNGVPFFSPLYVKEPIFAVVYHVHQKVFSEFLPKPLAALAAFIEKEVMPWAYKNVKFVAISQSTKTEMENLGIKGKGIEIVYSGINLATHLPGKKTKNPTILYVGRLKAYKSIDILIKAFKKVEATNKKAKLIIAGKGDEEKPLKELVKKLGLEDKVEFKGKVSESEKVKLYQGAWVFVNPSMMEGWGITTIEANACGTPVVASDVPGLRESVNNPHTGYLVNYGDIQDMSKSITSIITNDILRKTMDEKSQDWAKGFSWTSSAKKFVSLL